MAQALNLARQGAALDEVPVGAVVVRDDQLLGGGYNSPIGSCDPTGHAEIVALREASRHAANYRLPGTTLYVTIEPCTMCVGAMIHARVQRLGFGAREPRSGAVASRFCLLDTPGYNHTLSWSEGVLAEQCSELMTSFFRARRQK